jgi:hypothetical protein
MTSASKESRGAGLQRAPGRLFADDADCLLKVRVADE